MHERIVMKMMEELERLNICSLTSPQVNSPLVVQKNKISRRKSSSPNFLTKSFTTSEEDQ